MFGLLVVFLVAADIDGERGRAEGAPCERTTSAEVEQLVASVAKKLSECGSASGAKKLALRVAGAIASCDVTSDAPKWAVVGGSTDR